jgi:hypothetical protein
MSGVLSSPSVGKRDDNVERVPRQRQERIREGSASAALRIGMRI